MARHYTKDDLNIVSVKTFGAKGDGVTDDRNAIQSALNSVISQASGKAGAIVYFPAGVYLVSDVIKTYANVTIQGVGRRGSTILLKANSPAEAIIMREGGSAGYWTQIKDICLDGQASLQTVNTDGIKLEDCTEALIENVGIRFCRGHGINIRGESLQSVQPTIKNCVIRADKDNHMESACGIKLNTGSYDAMISGNDIGFYTTGSGIGAVQHNGAYFSHNNCWQCKNGFHLENCKRIRLTGNLSDYSRESGYYILTSSEIQLVNNQSRWSGMALADTHDGFNVFSSTDMLLSGNTVFSGDGTEVLTGTSETGQTKFALAVTGISTRIEVTGLMYKNCQELYVEPNSTRVSIKRSYSAPPTSGTWTVGTIVYNSAPSSGNPIGWVCTVEGTPGTWVGFGEVNTSNTSASIELLNNSKLSNLSGITSERPTLESTDFGKVYFDTTLGKPIWWNGTGWVDSSGTTV